MTLEDDVKRASALAQLDELVTRLRDGGQPTGADWEFLREQARSSQIDISGAPFGVKMHMAFLVLASSTRDVAQFIRSELLR